MKTHAPLTTPSFAPVEVAAPEFESWKRRYATAQRQPGLYSILIPVFLGNLETKDAIALASFLSSFGHDVVRATSRPESPPPQYSRGVSRQRLPACQHLLGAFLGPVAARQFHCLHRCRHLQARHLPAQRSPASHRPQAGEIRARRDQLADFKINLSGCPNTCGQHMVADLGFYGMVARKGQLMFPAYGIVAGAVVGDGKARLAKNIDRVSARDLPDFIVDLLKILS